MPRMSRLRVHTVGLIGFVALSREFALVAFRSFVFHFSGNVAVSGDNFWRLALKAIYHRWRFTQTDFRQLHHLWLERRIVQMGLL